MNKYLYIVLSIYCFNCLFIYSQQNLDSLYNISKTTSEKYYKSDKASYFRPLRSGLSFGLVTAMFKQLTLQYDRQIGRKWMVSFALGYNKYNKWNYLLYNHIQSPFVSINNRNNAFNNYMFNFLRVENNNTYGKGLFGLTFNYFLQPHLFNANAIQFGYRYRAASVPLSVRYDFLQDKRTIKVNWDGNVKISQNQFYSGFSHYHKIGNHLYTEFCMQAGINLIRYHQRVKSLYEIYGVDELIYFSNSNLSTPFHQSQSYNANIRSGKDIYFPSDDGKKPLQFAPYFMLDFRIGINF